MNLRCGLVTVVLLNAVILGFFSGFEAILSPRSEDLYQPAIHLIITTLLALPIQALWLPYVMKVSAATKSKDLRPTLGMKIASCLGAILLISSLYFIETEKARISKIDLLSEQGLSERSEARIATFLRVVFWFNLYALFAGILVLLVDFLHGVFIIRLMSILAISSVIMWSVATYYGQTLIFLIVNIGIMVSQWGRP